jgi:hypothetical protein
VAINKGEIKITGSDNVICGYFLHDLNIIRKASSRTGNTMLHNPAYDSFRKSTGRLKEASPVAAALYHQLPVELKQFTLYRQLTGETIKMLKEGMDKTLIIKLLYKQYIEPRLLHPENYPPVELRVKRHRTRGIHIYAGRHKEFPVFQTWKVPESKDKNATMLSSPPKDHPPL